MRFLRSAIRFCRQNRLVLVLGPGVLAIGLVLLLLGYGSLRRFVAESIGQETKHQVIALVSLPMNPPPETADLTPIAHTDVPPYAINVFLEQEVEEWKIRESLRLIQQAGFHFVKQQLVWGAIEAPEKGRYDDPNAPENDAWAKYDRIVDLAAEYGLEVIFRIDTSPEWARPDNEKLETPPDRPEDLGDFVATAVQRYRGRVHFYQIWNEPNLAFEWGGDPPDASGYVELLKAAYLRAKEIDPDVVIISAALAPTIEQSERGLSDTLYLQQMYDVGASSWFDVLGVNAYGLRHGPDDRRLGLATDVNFSRPILLRALMVQNGDAAKPIWASEIGWVALPPNFPEEPRYGQVTRETQARYTVRAYRRAGEEWPWMGVLALWHFRLIHPQDRIQQHYYFSVVDEELRPYPIYEALRTLTAEPPVLHRGYHKPTHWAVASEGTWETQDSPRASLGTTLIGQPGATLRFTFEGSQLRLAVNRQSGGGRLTVTIDGQPPVLPGATQRDAIATTDSIATEPGSPTSVTVFDLPVGQPVGRHEVELRVVDGPVALDGIIVDAWTPYQRFMDGALRVAVALGIVGWWLLGRHAQWASTWARRRGRHGWIDQPR